MSRKPLVWMLGMSLVVSTGCRTQGSQSSAGAPQAPPSSSSSSNSASSGSGIFQTILGVAGALMTSGGAGNSASGIGGAGTSSGGAGTMDAIGRILGGLAGNGGYTGTPSRQPNFLGQTTGSATRVPTGWQQALGSNPRSPSSGGGALADPSTTSVVPTGGVYRVVATAFWNQDVAGRTVEDGDNRLDSGERGMALPSRRGLGRWVAIRYRGRVAYAPVIDVGPVYTDDAYWEGDGVPRAVKNAGQQRSGPTNEVNGQMQRTTYTVNGQGADRPPATRRDLGMNTRMVKDTIEWWFVDEATGLANFRRQQSGQALVA